jgi:hypothetical protein
MFKGVTVAAFLFLLSITAQAQLPNASQGRVFQYDLIDGAQRRGLKPLAPDDQFIDPAKSLLKLNRQIEMQFLPPDFFPSFEQEDESVKRKALRYAVAYYRDCEVPGVVGLFDVLLGMRFDTRNGPLEVKYYHVATIVNPNKVQLPEDRPSMAILKAAECSVMLFLIDGASQQALITFEGIFTENPHAVNFIITDDVDGIKADESVQKFAIFVRGGSARASLFVLNTDVNLKAVETFEVIRDLPATDRAYIFGILPALIPYRGAVVTSKSEK